ncbi:MAG: insulinase family protein [Alphaproteobacteria bacterium]|nr:insulinase family protein [Alphaproteobacteria bacterium]
MPQLESVALGVWVNAGTRNETRRVMGVSHMLEHMAFKGTQRRSARAIAEEIEAVGGYLNAYTSREQTAFHARVLKSDVRLALDILADILTAPTFDEAELERERQVVLQEIGQARDTPDDIIFDHLQSVIYPGQPMGWPILGENETVSAFRREDLGAYMETNYRAGEMTLIASGRVDHCEVLDLAQSLFAGLKPGTASAPAPATYEGGDLRELQELEQAHVSFAFPGVSNCDDDYYVGQVYATALGGGMSSRLFQEARERRGLCYSIYAFSQSARDSGVVGVYAGTGEVEAGEIAAVVAGEMAALAEGASESEVSRAKAQLRSSVLMSLERPGSRAEQIAGQMFALGRVLSVEEMVARLDGVGVDAVRSFATRIMNSPRPSIAAIGPVAKLEGYDVFAGRFGATNALRAAE